MFGLTLTPADWAKELAQRVCQMKLPAGARLWVAYSGGLDSRVLLEVAALAAPILARELRVVHINHRIQAPSDAWAEHCRRTCKTLGLVLSEPEVDLEAFDGSMEERARLARYQAFESVLGEGDILLLAHHRDDQAETVLYRVIQGHGLKGLSGMPATRSLGRGRLFRPFLDCSRGQLESYARSQGFEWIEDPSNAQNDASRNFLRNAVLPLLADRFPAVPERLLELAEHMREAQGFQERQLQQGLESRLSNAGLTLDLSTIPSVDRPLLIRYWLETQGLKLRETQWRELKRQFLAEPSDSAQPRATLAGWELRMHRQRLSLLSATARSWLSSTAYRQQAWDWDGRSPLMLPDGRVLSPYEQSGPEGQCYRVSFPQGGERLWDDKARCHRDLKKVYQALGIPAWLRPLAPLLWQEGRLIEVLPAASVLPLAPFPIDWSVKL